jgi:hypothetical protein
MMTARNEHESHGFPVIHPLDDRPEVKHTGEGLGPMPLHGCVKVALWVLRGYLFLMAILVVYHLLDVAGFVGRHAG